MSESWTNDYVASSLALSKTHGGRRKLLRSGDLDKLCGRSATLLAAWEERPGECSAVACDSQHMLMLLRVLRNSCAAGSSVARIMQQHNIPQAVLQLAASIAEQQPGLKQPQQPPGSSDMPQATQPGHQQDLLLAAMQLLANLSVADRQSNIVWQSIFPVKLQTILSCQQALVGEAAALILLACVSTGRQALDDLTSPAAHTTWWQLLEPLMATGATHNSQGSSSEAPAASTATAAACNDNLCLLVKAVVLQHGRLQQLMSCLQLETREGANSIAASSQNSTYSESAAWADLQPNLAHAVLLHIVALEVSALPATKATGVQCAPIQQQQHQVQQLPAVTEPGQGCLPWLQYLAGLLRHLWTVATATSSGSSSSTVMAHLLEATLQVLQAVVSREDAGRALVMLSNSSSNDSSDWPTGAAPAPGDTSDCIQQLHALGLVCLLLDMLKHLGPPPRRQTQGQEAAAQPCNRHQQQQRVTTSLPYQAQKQKQQQPYVGYRADLVAALSSFLQGRRHIQDDVLSAGGIEVLLNNCNLDDTAPLAREWALWSIRTMCKGNEAVQKYISQFQAVEAVQSEELDCMGKELQLDKMTNRLKLVEKPRQQ